MPDDSAGQAAAGLWAGVAFLWLLLSVVHRRWRGKPMLARRAADARYVDRWASARCGTGLLARLGTARNCMHVQVTATQLRLHPHFPFTLGFMPEVYDLDHDVPLDRIRSATILGGHAVQAVEVTYEAGGSAPRVMQLLLRRAEAFVEALHEGADERAGA